MQVSIEGDHVMPLIWNRRLYVFWPMFMKKSKPPDTPAGINPKADNIPVQAAQPYWQVSLAWTELKHNKWTAKQVSKKALDIDPSYFVEDLPTRYVRYAYSFKSSTTYDSQGKPDSLVIRCVFNGPTVEWNRLGFHSVASATVAAFSMVDPAVAASLKAKYQSFEALMESTEVVGAFVVGGCSGESVDVLLGTMPLRNPITPPEADVEALTYVEKPNHTGLSLTKAGTLQTPTFLRGSPTTYRLLYPHQFSDYLLQAPLFYQDTHKTFFVYPHDESGPIRQLASPHRTAFRRGKAVAAHAAARPKHPAHGRSAARPPRHGDPGDVSEALIALEKRIANIGSDYTRHVTGRNSAWNSHALGHHAHPTNPTHIGFETFYHPFVCEFMKAVSRKGIKGLLTEHNQGLASSKDAFAHEYQPTSLVIHPLPMELVDFEHGPYAIYNQEIFFHIPDLIAERLLQNQRYDEAIRWLKFIFDPTKHAGKEAPPERFWNYLPFKKSPRDSLQHFSS